MPPRRSTSPTLERVDPPGDLDFEPRILPGDARRCRRSCSQTALDHHNVIGVEIRGELWAQPVPLELLVRTEIDLETGKVEIADLMSRDGLM